MSFTGKKKVLVLNMLLFALLFMLVSFNKEFIRPSYARTPFLGIVSGIFPNFMAAFLISMAFVNAVVIREPRHRRLIVYAASLLVFAVLAVEEIKPMWGASTYYDLFDILASGVGSLLAIFVFEIVILIRRKRLQV